ncbi:MAG: DUF4236 domain-containing protein [Betaproteobacteria bacterium]|nr:DUF4236 domain-containing protein [Betaproteobacteria bacterium]
MGWRWRKTLGRGPLRWTVSRRGIGWSFGVPGFRYGRSPSGCPYISIGLPGTGLYWIKYLGRMSHSGGATTIQESGPTDPLTPALPTSSGKTTTANQRLLTWKQQP